MIEINDVIYADPEKSKSIKGYVRIVGVDHNNFAYLIRLDSFSKSKKLKLNAPYTCPIGELIHEIEQKEILLGVEFDCSLLSAESSLSKAARDKLAYARNLLDPFLADENILFDPIYRSRSFKQRADEYKTHPRTIHRLYYQYLWGGQTYLAMAPRFNQRGGLGKPQKTKSARRGKKAKNSKSNSLVKLPDVRIKLEKGAKLFFLQGSRTLEEAFMATKKKFFSKGVRFTPDVNMQKIPIEEILLPPEQLPTLRQYRYICEIVELALGKKRKLPRRIRQKPTDWEFRGRSRDNVPGPGYRYEIDATKIQIRPVSRFDRSELIYTLTLYVIIDVWSGAYVGYTLSTENASWALAAEALRNCFTDKQEVFTRLNLDYTSDDWPCHHLPSNLTADRAELISNKAEPVPQIGIKVEIMPPMAPERKGKVEASFKDIKHGHSLSIPGSFPKSRVRRETDGSATAALTVEELEKIIVEIIMGLNHDPVPASHIPPELIESGETDITHIGLYRWGLKHLPGFTRKMSPTEVFTNLMTKGTASLTNRGLYFEKQTFTSPEMVNAAAYKRPSGNKGLLVDIRYNEHRAGQIRFLNKKTNEWVPAVNDNPDIKRRQAAFYELEALRLEIEHLRRASKDQSLHQKDEQEKRIKAQIKKATQETKDAMKGKTKSSRKKNMRINSDIEKEVAAMISEGSIPQETPPVFEQTILQASKLPEISSSQNPTSKVKQSPQSEMHPEKPSKLSTTTLSKQLWEQKA